MKVLLVSAERGAAHWSRHVTPRFEVRHAHSLAAAATQLDGGDIDAIVIDAAVAGAGNASSADLTRLRESAPGVPLLLVTDDGRAPDVGGAGLVDGLLPAAPPEVQARLVELAAERAALAGALQERTEELERRSRELEDSRRRFRDVIERNADAIIVVDTEGVIRFANAAAAALFRNSRAALIGTPFGFPMVAGETTELDLVHDGEARMVEMRVVESEWEGAQACIASLRDITERKRAEEAARRLIREQAARTSAEQAARRFRFLADSSTVLSAPLDYRTTLTVLARWCVTDVANWAMIYVCEEHGQVRRLEISERDGAHAEAVRTLRDTPIDMAGRHPVIDVVRNCTALLMHLVDDASFEALAQEEPCFELIRRHGACSFMLVPLIARNRCVGALGLVSTDAEHPYTEQDLALAQDLALRAALAFDNARLYTEAQRANQSKTDLLAVISHDLRTPLNAIIGYADLFELGIPEQLSESSLERMTRIRKSARHLLYLIDELLSFARLEAGREELRLRDVDVGSIAHDVAAVGEPLAQQRNLAFVLDTPAHALPLHTDPDKVRQVLLNLVANAVKYTREGEVRLSVQARPDGNVQLSVRDTGVGIEPEHLPNIFEPFWQVDGSQRNSENGTGLGLSVVQRLVRLLGGAISVESTPGTGSTFTVTLPSRRDAETSATELRIT